MQAEGEVHVVNLAQTHLLAVLVEAVEVQLVQQLRDLARLILVEEEVDVVKILD
jgi:hypothetical protein